ncbi:MAG: isopenicillin N synthase-like dioxygenase [Candidatus Aldehydirespiratoraceae bacterium]
MEVLTDVGESFALEESGDDVEPFIEAGASGAGIHDLIEPRKFASGIGAGADANGQASVTHQVDGQNLARQLDRSAPRHRGNHRAEADRGGGGSHRSERNPRVDDLVRLGSQDVVPEEQSVPARLFSCGREIDELVRIGETAERCNKDPVLHTRDGRRRLPRAPGEHFYTAAMSNSFDPAAREAELRSESESWDTSAPAPAGDGDIPIIDVARWFATDDPVDLATIAAELRTASEEVGFFQLTGHGFDPLLMDRAFEANRALHALSPSTKESIAMDRPGWPLGGVGYMGVGNRKLPARAVGNRNEAFLIKHGGEIEFSDNQWPDEAALPGFRAAVEACARSVSALAGRLVTIYAVALELEADYFNAAFNDPFFRLRFSHYPAKDPRDATEAFGIAPHVDTTFFTLLRHDGPGLTIFHAARQEWIVAPVVADAFVVNGGELLRQWSNDRFRSARHYANNLSDRSRYSIPFFFNANADHVMETLPTCHSPNNPVRYPPVSYRQSQAAVQGE